MTPELEPQKGVRVSPQSRIGVMIVEDEPQTREGLEVLVDDTQDYSWRSVRKLDPP